MYGEKRIDIGIAIGLSLVVLSLLIVGVVFHWVGESVRASYSKPFDETGWRQESQDPRYFWGHLPATADVLLGRASTGFDLNLPDVALEEAIARRIEAFSRYDLGNEVFIPGELLAAAQDDSYTAVSLQAALFQVPRIATLRHLDLGALTKFVNAHVQQASHPRVDLWYLNQDLDALYPS